MRWGGESVTEKLIWWQMVKGLLTESNRREEFLRVMSFAASLREKRAKSDDPFIYELASYYRKTTPARLMMAKSAHSLVTDGHRAHTTDRQKASLFYQRAAAEYELAGSEGEAAFARFWMIYCMKDDATKIERLRRMEEECENRRYRWLSSLICNELASRYFDAGLYYTANQYIDRAIKFATRVSNQYGILKRKVQYAQHLTTMGDLSKAQVTLAECLGEGEAEVAEDRMVV